MLHVVCEIAKFAYDAKRNASYANNIVKWIDLLIFFNKIWTSSFFIIFVSILIPFRGLELFRLG